MKEEKSGGGGEGVTKEKDLGCQNCLEKSKCFTIETAFPQWDCNSLIPLACVKSEARKICFGEPWSHKARLLQEIFLDNEIHLLLLPLVVNDLISACVSPILSPFFSLRLPCNASGS